MAEKRYSIRIYDKKLDDRIQKVYNDLPLTFKTMNDLMKEMLDRGLRTIEKDLYNKKENDLSSLFDEIRHTSKQLDLLLKIIEEKLGEILISHKVLQKLVGCNYNLLMGINNSAPKDNEYVEKGFYDKLPDRLKAILEEALKKNK